MLSLDEQLKASMRFSDREKSLRASIGADLSSLATHLQRYTKLLVESESWYSKQIRAFNRQCSEALAQTTRFCAEFREFIRAVPDFCDKSAVSALSELTRLRYSPEQAHARNRSLLAQISSVEATKLTRFYHTSLITFDRLIEWAAFSLQELTKLRATAAQMSQRLEVLEIEGRLSGLDLGDELPFRSEISKLVPISRKTQTLKMPHHEQPTPSNPPHYAEHPDEQTYRGEKAVNNQQCAAAYLAEAHPFQKICLIDEAEDVPNCNIPVYHATAMKFQLADDEHQTKDSDQQTEMQIDRDIDYMWYEYSVLKNQLVSSGIL